MTLARRRLVMTTALFLLQTAIMFKKDINAPHPWPQSAKCDSSDIAVTVSSGNTVRLERDLLNVFNFLTGAFIPFVAMVTAAWTEPARAAEIRAPRVIHIAQLADISPTIDTPSLPDAYKLNMLIRSTLIALSQANQTGNYSVLRDLGTPKFQATNSSAQLAEIFSTVRSRNLDLSPIMFYEPKLFRPPAIDDGLLRLTGFLETAPERVLFDLGFEQVDGQWRIAALIVDIKSVTADPLRDRSGKIRAPDKR